MTDHAPTDPLARRLLRGGAVLLLVAAVAVLVIHLRGPARPAPAAFTALGRGPTVVIVHGLGSGPAHWQACATLLARDHRVLLVDLPGHGGTPLPQPFTLERAVESLDGVLATERDPVVLVGHSVGGLVAAEEAIEHPERVRALVLVDAALRPQITGEDREHLLSRLESDYRGVLRGAYQAFGRDSAQGERLYEEVAALDPANVKPWIQLALHVELTERMSHLRAPLLAVLSDRSWEKGEPWPHAAAALGYDRAPRVEPVRVEGCGHFIMIDQPARLAELIERFAARPDVLPASTR